MRLGRKDTYTCPPNTGLQECVRVRARVPRPADSEKDLEARLRKAVEKRGGMAVKLLSQLHRGLPDRLVLMPGGHAWFVETKSTGKKPTRLQKHCHDLLRKLGFEVWVIDDTFGLDSLLVLLDDEQAFDKAKEFEL